MTTMKNLIMITGLIISITACQADTEKNTSAKKNIPSTTGKEGITLKEIGPGAGGSMFGVAIHPKNPDIIIFGGDMGTVGIDPGNSDIVYAAEGCAPR